MKQKNKVRVGMVIVISILLCAAFWNQWKKWQIKEPLTDTRGKLKVHFIDAGQADAVLIQADGENLLIDGGDNRAGEKVVSYLRELGVTSLKYVIATHGHQDHAGGLDAVIYNFTVGGLFLPRQGHDTHIYQDMLDAAEAKKVPVIVPEFQETHRLGEAKFMFVAEDPEEEYEDVNDSSLGIRLSNGAHSFLMCGDISSEMEKRLVKTGVYLKADVLKLNHHGSSDANSRKFLNYVKPEYAVVCCGKQNEFGHPHPSVLKRLEKLHIRLFRTDLQGTIVFTSDGEKLICSTEPVA